jgi:dTDP-4-amino-4,6-dideoxygalactose transaminase
MKVRFFDPGKGYLKIKDEVDAKMQELLKKGDLVLREEVEVFEAHLAAYVGTKYAVALNSGTDAIYLSLKALNLKEGARVGVPSHTFKSTCGSIIHAGLTPCVYDLDGQLEGPPVEAHIPVHIAGELSPVLEMGIPIIEDACQALGALKHPTSNSQCWSFYPAKLLGSYGDAGAITTNDPVIYEYVKEARNHFKTDNRDFGINSRMDNLQAAILNIKLKYFDEVLKRREWVASMYRALEGVGLPEYNNGRVWQDYIIRTERRDELFEFLGKQGIETMKNEYPFSPEYPKPPIAAKYEAETLRIPCNENLTEEEVYYVISKINEFSNV